MAALGALIPGLDFSRSSESLYAYVRYIDNGWERTEPQDGQSGEEQAPASLLYEQGRHRSLVSN